MLDVCLCDKVSEVSMSRVEWYESTSLNVSSQKLNS